MKYIVLFTIFFFTCFNSISQEKKEANSDVTTYYLIRHAEKDRSNASERNPHLTQKGLERAQKWSEILGNIKFDAVYSTNYHRTEETAKPTADKNELDIIIYNPNIIDTPETFLKDTKGKTVLVVGHSNTTPAFVNAIIDQKKYKDIDDSNNGNVYIITIIGGKIVDQVLTIN